jgi:hypothetical protein
VRAIQSSLDFHLRTAKTRADFFAWHAPAVAIPADGVIVGDLALHAHAIYVSQPGPVAKFIEEAARGAKATAM